MAGFRLTARVGAKVDKERFATLDEALTALEERLEAPTRNGTVEFFRREYSPAEQVAGRFELRGPGGVNGGIDVRGDGAAEAYRGRIRKQPVEQAPGESAVDALRRVLTS